MGTVFYLHYLTMKQFKITDRMEKRCKKYKEWLEAEDMETRRRYWIDFCEELGLEWCFDTWGDFYDWEISLMYVADVQWLTVIIDWDIWRDTIGEFLDLIDSMENEIIRLNNVLIRNDR